MVSRTSVSPVDLSSAANLWRFGLSREISATLYPALAKRRLWIGLGVNKSWWRGNTYAVAPPVPEEFPTPATTKRGRIDMVAYKLWCEEGRAPLALYIESVVSASSRGHPSQSAGVGSTRAYSIRLTAAQRMD